MVEMMGGGISYQLILLFQIAAISPADINYDESASTLRYGQYIILCYEIYYIMQYITLYSILHCI